MTKKKLQKKNKTKKLLRKGVYNLIEVISKACDQDGGRYRWGTNSSDNLWTYTEIPSTY